MGKNKEMYLNTFLQIISDVFVSSAMWMLPDDWVYGGWPMSGEIDITETIGNVLV